MPSSSPLLSRRRLLALAGAAWPAGRAAASDVVPADALLDDLERRAFAYFWERADPATGLVPDRWPKRSAASIAGVGFALSAYPVGVARGFVGRDEARARVRTTLAFLHDAPQGAQRAGAVGHKGFFYHFIDRRTLAREPGSELSTGDTALLLAGALHCRQAFDADHPDEQRIRELADALVARVDWRWAQPRAPLIVHGWTPERGFLPYDWLGYSEAMLTYLLALGAPRPVASEAWAAWTRGYDWAGEYGQTYLRFASLFGHQYTHCWVDFRGLRDAFMRSKGIDYFENTRRATYAQQAYAIANPEGWAGYGRDAWGISACDGPAPVERPVGGRLRRFRAYAGRGIGGAAARDDGTLAPYAVASSLPFAPEIARPTLAALKERHGDVILGRYGFYAFNPSFGFADVALRQGRVVPGFGWVDDDFLAVELGPTLAMLANHRGEVVWRALRGSEPLRSGLARAGFTGGWLG